MDLGDGGRGDGREVELLDLLGKILTQGVGDDGLGPLAVKRRHMVLQQRQLVGVVGGEQVAAGGKQLAELDEHRPKLLQGEPQPHLRAGGAASAASAPAKP